MSRIMSGAGLQKLAYSPLPPDYVRLLKLECRKGSQEPRGELINHHIDRLPPYSALSYAWGDQNPEQGDLGLFCDGQELSVTPNLHRALRRLVKSGESALYWIDQICINQCDKGERSTQVGMMGRIYERASRVVIWLGEAPSDLRTALSAIPAILSALQTVSGTVLITEANFRALKLPKRSSPIWSTLGALFASKWFTRLWVLQEAVLAKEICTLYGDDVLNWEVISSLASAILQANLASFLRGDSGQFTKPKDQADGVVAGDHDREEVDRVPIAAGGR
ncbi:hypothetical protein LTS07_000336 [Exophiala sideris]|uniref:Heterokaryon incompatibility domain-containing protein n=1 Tax=Exophiala sideris TaxID=1016849 RepID=A0ABR0JR97_9EURO|nr:hypothetical protein LTS07_000336 [Exophiala sideris]KAK5041393.1 hypothetical protein LTR13_002868 [Exophiala sideris]KAK5068220.1 hypothetical protein LTR69_000338 [Exophiala sideris]KAK5187521.1 hypothetical protein LTR44_000337 [Eurotiomycetes sp. CCFEE 6388]